MQTTNEAQEKQKKIGLGMKVTTFFLIVFFFFPLCTVSCSGTEVEITGAKAAFGFEIMGRQVEGELICGLLLLIPIAVLAGLLMKKMVAVLSIAGGIIDIIILLVTKSKITEMAEQAYCDVEFGPGYYGGMILNAILIILAVLYQKNVQTEDVPNVAIQPGTDESVCPSCGTPVKDTMTFCMKCGQKLEGKDKTN